MKKLKLLMIGCALSVGLSSCIVAQSHSTTGNPVGSKIGVAENKMFSAAEDVSIHDAAKNGGINKIATVDYTITSYLIFIKRKVVVTGE